MSSSVRATTLVKELREHADSFNNDGPLDNPGAWPDLYRMAADEIERLLGIVVEIHGSEANYQAVLQEICNADGPVTEKERFTLADADCRRSQAIIAARTAGKELAPAVPQKEPAV